MRRTDQHSPRLDPGRPPQRTCPDRSHVRLPPSAPDPAQAWPTPSPRLPGLTAALHALGTAARGLASWLTRPDPPAHATVTGIDYLALIARQHRHEVLRRLRLADPSSGAGHATPWELVTILTAGRLLTGVPG